MSRNRTQKLKTWIHDHKDGIVLGSIATGISALYVAAFYIDSKQKEANAQEAKRIRDWTINQNARGRTIFTLADGSLLAVDAEDLLK